MPLKHNHTLNSNGK